MEAELEAALSRQRYVRSDKPSDTEAGGARGVTGHRHGHPRPSLTEAATRQ
jgi:hypothetical protein